MSANMLNWIIFSPKTVEWHFIGVPQSGISNGATFQILSYCCFKARDSMMSLLRP